VLFTAESFKDDMVYFVAIYGKHIGLFDINTLKMIEGDLPKRAEKPVIEWGGTDKNELKHLSRSQI